MATGVRLVPMLRDTTSTNIRLVCHSLKRYYLELMMDPGVWKCAETEKNYFQKTATLNLQRDLWGMWYKTNHVALFWAIKRVSNNSVLSLITKRHSKCCSGYIPTCTVSMLHTANGDLCKAKEALLMCCSVKVILTNNKWLSNILCFLRVTWKQ